MRRLIWVINICFIFLGMIFVLFLGVDKVSAQDSSVVINEVMANPAGSDTGNEWIEFYNSGTDVVDLTNWKIKLYNDPLSSTPTKTIILAGEAILSDEYYVYNNTTTTAITNSKGKIVLQNPDNSYEHTISWSKDVGDGYSMEIIGAPFNTTYTQWLSTRIIGGTQGEINSVSGVLPPEKPKLISPENNQKIFAGSNIDFIYEEENDIVYQIQIASDDNFTNLVDDTDLMIGKYYWKVSATNILGQTVESNPFSFEIIEPVYSDNIIVNELYPDPGSGDEWIELYNNSADSIDLHNWLLQDESGNEYLVPYGIIISPFGHVVLKASFSLNNTGDLVKLFNPNKKLVSESTKYQNGEKGWSWARGPDNNWSWTTKITPEFENIIILPTDDINNINSDTPVNTTPIEVKTGEVPNYDNYLVQLTGTVTKTSGNTFYLDDGTGIIKIYIQDKTGIEKPAMHTGDTFTVVGLVDLYGNTWRILPQKQDDIKLVKCIKVVTVKKTTKKVASATKKSTADKISKASSIMPKAKAVSGENTEKNKKTPFWLQIVELLVGLGVIGLVILVIKISHREKDPIIGGHFGDDLT